MRPRIGMEIARRYNETSSSTSCPGGLDCCLDAEILTTCTSFDLRPITIPHALGKLLASSSDLQRVSSRVDLNTKIRSHSTGSDIKGVVAYTKFHPLYKRILQPCSTILNTS